MEQKSVRKVLQIEGMTCTSCELRIENKLKRLEGVIEVKAMYNSANVYITYDTDTVGLDKIIEAIEKLDYKVKNNQREKIPVKSSEVKNKSQETMPVNQLLGIGIIILALYLIIKHTIGFNFIPQVNPSTGYGILFVVGLFTSLHCIAMCGGINLSQCVSYKYNESDNGKLSKLKPSFLYNAGRVISYTVVGGIVGGLGSVVSFSGTAKGFVAILAGLFMVLMGVNMLNIFPALRKFNPRMPRIFGNKVHHNQGKHGPLVVGMLNGLMPCGPLQAMQLYALGTGSILAGATSMLLFSLGTVPLMFGFGALSSLLSGKFTKKMMKVSALLVVILGIIMVNRGLNLSGVNVAYAAGSSNVNIAKIEGNVQTVSINLTSGRYAPIVVQKGIPVKFTIKADAKDINGCNGTVTIPKFGISKKLEPGDNVIPEFTPTEEGNIRYTCWMGMISSNIKVVGDITKASNTDVSETGTQSSATGSTNSSGGCCGTPPAGFAGGKIPTDKIGIATMNDHKQEVTVTVNNQGYSPAAIVLQKGIPAKIKFNTEQIGSCNSTVVFPELQGQLDLTSQKETPFITPTTDFTFQCGMAMLHGYVKVVDDINKVNLEEVKKEVQNFKPTAGSNGGSCCG